MLKATLRSLTAHKLRLALTSLAVVLGVGFVAGSFVLTDTLNATFVRLFKQVDGGVDVRVRSRSTFTEQDRGGNSSKYQPVPEALVERVRQVPGVEAVTGDISGFAQMVDRSGDVIGGDGPPTIGAAASQDQRISRLNVVDGRLPAESGEVAIDAGTAKDAKFGVGDRIKVLLRGPAEEFTVSGVVKVGSADNLAGATLAIFEPETAHRVLDRPGTFDSVDVKAGGVSQTVLRDRIDAALGGEYDVITGEKLAAQEAQEVSNSFVKFIGIALGIFAGVALLVGTFLISNTFSIIVASRTRELALLRALGARRRQILVSVLGEAALTGLVSSAVGVGFGYLVATGLKALLAAFGGNLPESATVLAARTVIVALVVGVVVTVVSSILPAVRATRVSPMAALRDSGIPSGGDVGAARIVVGVMFLALGGAGLGFGLSDGDITLVGLGALGILIGVAVLAVFLARPMARVIGFGPARLFNLPGRLARDNAMRNPARTASTAAALMIGLALVTFVAVLSASIKVSLEESFDRSFAADYVVTGRGFEGFSPELAAELRQLPELSDVVSLAAGQWRLNGDTTSLTATELSSFARLFNLKTVAGTVPPDDGSGLMVEEEKAKSNGWSVGDLVPMEFATTGVQQVPLVATYERSDFAGEYLLATADFERNFASRLAQIVVVKADQGVVAGRSRLAMAPVLEAFPNAELKDQAQFKASITASVNQIQGLITVLLALAIVIAVLGILNTLALSVLERTREVGLLRAVGMSRRQTRRMIRWEAVIVAVIGAVLGVSVGVFFGWAVVRAIHDTGITTLSVPGGQLLGYVVIAGVLGVLAAVFPARRAARLNVLAAIAYE
ncbi:MAG: FtsX-like permease family protein [Acidimicrobiia bacterium]|nr:FtsX-like permease family protein [Acidimicrobiia bacterium]